jgi:hypothetical protein
MKAQSEMLRAALDCIMKIPCPTTFKSAFEKVQKQHNHTVCNVPVDKNWLNTFNCYAFALSIVCNPRYRAFVQKPSNYSLASSALANSGFMSMLLKHGELTEVDEVAAKAGNLVLYFADGCVRHAGVIITDNRRVRSKWGPNELYEHSLWEVPESYGQQARFVCAPNPERIMDLLEKYVANNNKGPPRYRGSRVP